MMISSMNYLQIAQAWEQLLNVRRVSVVSNALTQDPIRAFFQIAGLTLQERDAPQTSAIVNPTLDGLRLEFKYFLNNLDLTEQQDGGLMGQINRLEMPKEVLSLFTEPHRAALIGKFQSVNDELARNYGCAPMDPSEPHRDRMMHPLSGKDLFEMFDRLAEVDARLAWMLHGKMRQMIQG